MKTTNMFFIILYSFALSILMPAQDINVHYMIGKKQSQVIKKYGNPVHRDDSNSAMLCMFYKSNQNSMIFVANKAGVYQSEANKIYVTRSDALKDLDFCIAISVTNGYSVDTVSISDFRLRSTGVRADIQMMENKLTDKFEIRVKANKSEN